MLGLTATNNSTPSVQTQLSAYQSQLQQARHEAAQAANRVERLEQQAQVARQEAARAEEKVRGLESQPPRSDSSGSTNRNRKTINSLSHLSGTLLDETA